MTIATEIHEPKLDLARIRRLRATAGLTLEQCVEHSGLQENWMLIECCPNVVVDRKTIDKIAGHLDCEPNELVYPDCPLTAIPELVKVFDSENADSESQLRVIIKIVPEDGVSEMTVDFNGASPEEIENFWDMLTERVTP